MDVLVVGGHGKVALRLQKLLVERGHSARGIIRDPDQAADLERVGAKPVLLDIETRELGDTPARADAVVFAAGAGAGSGPERKRTVDHGGAVKLIEAARANDISRYLMVSAIGANRPESWSDEMRPYYEAKAAADAALEQSTLEWTIARPGRLTDDPGTGMVNLAPEEYGSVPRDDVALVLVECLESRKTIRKAFDVVAGQTPAAEAVRAL